MEKGIRVLRDYQLAGIKAVQNSIKSGNTRFLLEMATGTGKTLTSAGIIKMFIRSDLAHRVLYYYPPLQILYHNHRIGHHIYHCCSRLPFLN